MTKAKKSPRKSAKTRRNRRSTPKTTRATWNQLAGFTANGARMATLHEVVDPKVPTKSLIELSEDELFELIVKRLEMEPDDFKVAMFGVGIVDKNRAIAEVKARSRIGRNLAEIEQRVINLWVRTRTS